MLADIHMLLLLLLLPSLFSHPPAGQCPAGCTAIRRSFQARLGDIHMLLLLPLLLPLLHCSLVSTPAVRCWQHGHPALHPGHA
jgi:hypothetical protein